MLSLSLSLPPNFYKISCLLLNSIFKRFLTCFFFQYNSDDTVEILSPHGDIYHSTPFSANSPFEPPTGVKCESMAPSQPISPTTRPGSKKSKQTKAQTEEPVAEHQPVVNEDKKVDDVFAVEWHVLSGRGEQWIIKKNKEEEFLEDLLISDATCYDTNEVSC